MQIETMLVQASKYQNDSNRSLESSRQHSYKEKHKKCQKCNTRHGKQDYPKTIELNVPRNPRCDVGCESYKVDFRNELCSVQFMSFNKLEYVTCMHQI